MNFNTRLMLQFVKQDFLDRYAGSVLGVFWSLLLPLSTILIFTLVFSKVMGMRLSGAGMGDFGAFGYSIYLVSGVLAWNAFAGTLTRTTSVYSDKAYLIKKVRLSLVWLPMYVVVSETIVYAISSMFFIGFLLVIDYTFTVYWLALPIVFAIQQFLALALGMILAVMNVFFKDVKELVGIVTQLWFWVTPIVYVISILPEEFYTLVSLNPYFWFVDMYHSIVVFETGISLLTPLAILTVSVVIFIIAIWMVKRVETDIRDIV